MGIEIETAWMAHLLRRCREIIPVGGKRAAEFPRRVQAILQVSLHLRDRRDQSQISEHGLQVARGRLEARLVASSPGQLKKREHGISFPQQMTSQASVLGRAPVPVQSTIHPYCQQVEVKKSTLARFGMKPKPIPKGGQSCSDLRRPRDYKSGSPQRGSEEPQSALYEGEGEI